MRMTANPPCTTPFFTAPFFTAPFFGRVYLRAGIVLMALSCLALATLAPSAARADESARQYVGDLGDSAIAILGDDTLTPEETETRFRALLLGALDIRRLGLFALGQYARLPTPQQREEYFELLADFIVAVYLNRLSSYSDEKFVVTDSIEKGSKGREVIVSSDIVFSDGTAPLPVQWWLIRDPDAATFKVFDVNVAGIWMAQEQRGTFASQIRNNGGQFEALLDGLRAETRLAQTGAEAG